MAADIKECPFCGEIIKAKARKCRFCDEFLELGLTREGVLIEQAEEEESVAQAESPPSAAEKETPQAPQEKEPVKAPAPEGEALVEGEAQVLDNALCELYQRLAQMPDSPEKDLVAQTLKQLEAESQKGEEADEDTVEELVKGVMMAMPDVAEIAINTIINPVSGLTTLVQKVAKRVAESQQEKEEEDKESQKEDEEKAPAQAKVDVETAVDTLGELYKKLKKMPDSPEKELVAQTLAQLEAESQKGEEADKGTIDDLISSLSKMLPDLAEAAVDTVQEVAEAVAENNKE